MILLLILGLFSLMLIFSLHGMPTASERRELELQAKLDSLYGVVHDREIQILEYENQVETLEDQLRDCYGDLRNCLAGRYGYRIGDLKMAREK